jgi:hypothetical protein
VERKVRCHIAEPVEVEKYLCGGELQTPNSYDKGDDGNSQCPVPVDRAMPFLGLLWRMDVERIIHEIEQLQEMFEAPDIRPLSASDISAANRRHDETLANSPWFKLWQSYGVCCRPGSPEFRLGEPER